MSTHFKRPGLAAICLALAAGILLPRWFVAEASNPHGAVYSSDNSRVFWFIHASDTHIGASGSSTRLTWLVTTGKTVIAPQFIVVTGDLTDSTNGNWLGIPNGPYQAEWDTYKSILSGRVDATNYYDIPGNHDAYSDAHFSYYLANSIQGQSRHTTQVSWDRTFSFGKYHFLGVNTADNTGAGFSFSFPYGDHAGLDAGELSFIGQDLADNADARLTFVFGHHPVTDTGVSTDTWLFYGQQEFIADLDASASSTFNYGHTHESSQTIFKGNSYTGVMQGDGIAYLNVASLAKSSSTNYSIVAVDNDGVSVVTPTVGTWPVVVITAPMDAKLGGVANPYTYSVPAAANSPIRALVFDANPVTQVRYRIDGGTTWYPMARVPTNTRLWETTTWNASALAAGAHTIEVQATGTSVLSDMITVNITATGNQVPTAVSDSYSTLQDTRLTVGAPGVLGNDSDPDGNAITAQLAVGPSNGTLVLGTNGSFTYAPKAGFAGSDSFTYTAYDGTASSNTATVTITVTAAATDTVTIKSATYTARKKVLAVQATSSMQPNATLMLTAPVTAQMKYSSKTRSYSVQVSVSTAPAQVTVTSNKGGSATAPVTPK